VRPMAHFAVRCGTVIIVAHRLADQLRLGQLGELR
jgi:hypothetical protein